MTRKFLICVWILLLFPNPLFSQEKEGRKNLIEKTVEKTGQTVKGMTQMITEPIRDPKAAFSTWFDYNPEIERGEKKNYNLLPLFVSSPERGQGFGLKYAQQSLLKKDDILRIQAVQTLKNKSSYELMYEFPPNILSWASRFGGELEMTYENYTKFYYGMGNQSQKEDESEYTPEFFAVRVPLLFGVTNKIYAGVALKYENWTNIKFGNAGIIQKDLLNLVGRDGSRLYTTSILLRWDSRNSKTDPSQGVFLEGNMEYSKPLLGSETEFNRYTLEWREFEPIAQRNDHVFCARLYLDYKNGDVPFYHLPELGGIFFNRGLIEGRFRDNLSLNANWEYRLKIYQRLHWAFFVDAGNVYGEFKYITLQHSKLTGGTGMRYYVPPGNLLMARVDGGYSTEGFLLYLTFDQPF